MSDCDQIIINNSDTAITLIFGNKKQIWNTIGRLTLKLFKKESIYELLFRMNGKELNTIN